MRREHPELAVDRHDRLRAQQAEQRAQLLGAGMAGDVHVGVLLVQHLGAAAGEAVDRVVDAQFVPRHGARRDDHRVAALDLHGRVVVVGDAGQRRERLALRAGAEDQLALAADVVEVGGLHEHVVGHLDVAEVAGDVEVLAHRAADHGHRASHLDRDVDRLLHAVNVRGERGDQHATLLRRDDLPERLADDSLRAVKPGRSAFVESPSRRSTPRLPSSARRPTSVRRPSTGVWSSFQSPVWKTRPAEVSRQMPTASGTECDMRTNSSAERPELDAAAVRADLPQLAALQQAVLVELRLDEAERQPGREDLSHANLAQEVGQRADVILVRVREDHRQTSRPSR